MGEEGGGARGRGGGRKGGCRSGVEATESDDVWGRGREVRRRRMVWVGEGGWGRREG